MKYIKSAERKQQLLGIACDLAEESHFLKVRRRHLADKSGTATGNVSRVLGDMEQMRCDLIAYAIKHKRLVVIAQAVIDKHPAVAKLDEKLKKQALKLY